MTTRRKLSAPLRILTGQTASGKGVVAVELARMTGAELISVDSIKVYRGLDVGAAKPPRAVRDAVPFHLVDVVESGESFSLANYLAAARAAVDEIAARGRPAVFVGGTPLYLRGLLYGIFEGPAANWPLREQLTREAAERGTAALHEELRRLDPVTAERLHPNDLTRIIRALEVARGTGRPISEHQRQYPAPAPAVEYRMVALRRGEEELKRRIRLRTRRMFEAGIVEEVRRVLDGGGMSRSAQKAIGYREVLAHLRGELTLEQAVASVERNTWRLARKQRAWLKSFPDVQWLDLTPEEPVQVTAARVHDLLFGSAPHDN